MQKIFQTENFPDALDPVALVDEGWRQRLCRMFARRENWELSRARENIRKHLDANEIVIIFFKVAHDKTGAVKNSQNGQNPSRNQHESKLSTRFTETFLRNFFL